MAKLAMPSVRRCRAKGGLVEIAESTLRREMLAVRRATRDAPLRMGIPRCLRDWHAAGLLPGRVHCFRTGGARVGFRDGGGACHVRSALPFGHDPARPSSDTHAETGQKRGRMTEDDFRTYIAAFNARDFAGFS